MFQKWTSQWSSRCYTISSSLGHPGLSPYMSSTHLPQCKCLKHHPLPVDVCHCAFMYAYNCISDASSAINHIPNLEFGSLKRSLCEEMLQTIYHLHTLRKCYTYHYIPAYDVTSFETLFTPWTPPRMLYLSFSVFPNVRTALCLCAPYLSVATVSFASCKQMF